MALIVSAASGNFNAGATWVGGVVPGAADEGQAANGHTITITANATCTEISNAGTGTFVLNGGVTLTANVTHKTLTGGVTLLTYSSSTSSTIAGNITGNGASNLSGTNNVVRNTGSGVLIVNGTNHASGAQASNSVAITNAGAGNIEITGNCTAGTGLFCGPAVQNTGSGNVIITGNVTAANGGNISSGAVNSSTTGTVTVFGTITAAQSNAGIYSTSTGPLILTGPFIMANNGRLAVWASFWRWASTINSSTYFQIPTSNLLSTRNLVTADNITGMPAASDVKSGIAYGPTSELTGTFSQTVTPSTADIATAVWSAASRTITGGTVNTLTNAPTVPTAAAIATQVRTELTTELNRLDTNVASRAASGTLASDVTAIKAKTDALNVDRVNNTATLSQVGNLLAQANS